MGGIIRQAHDGPLCPGSYAPANTWHEAETQFENRLHEALKPFKVDSQGQPDPEGGELPPELDQVYSKVAYSDTYKRMILHSEATSYPQGMSIVLVEAYFWKCHLCGFILPATAVSR